MPYTPINIGLLLHNEIEIVSKNDKNISQNEG